VQYQQLQARRNVTPLSDRYKLVLPKHSSTSDVSFDVEEELVRSDKIFSVSYLV